MGGKKSIGSINPAVAKTLKGVLKLFFRKMFKVRLDMPDEVYNLNPPYILLPNHQGFWDPFLAGAYLKHPIYYITSDAVFRSKLFRFLLKFLGAVPKTKAQSDLDALKTIFQLKEEGKCVGIFAEGQRTWNGKTLPIIKSTAKLIRMLNIPVVAVVFKGGFFSHPRWGTSVRKGELLIEYNLLFKEGETGKMKTQDIHEKLTEALSHDEVEYQKQNRIEFKGDRFAENIEQMLFCCPSCGSFEGFRSKRSKFECLDCRSFWEIDGFQAIKPGQGEVHFDNVRDWDDWQLKKLYTRIDENFGTDKDIFYDDGVEVMTGYKSQKLNRLFSGKVSLTSSGLNIWDGNGKSVIIPVEKISGINVQNREVLDFYYDNKLYVLCRSDNRFNAYKLWRAVKYLQQEKLKMNLPE